MAKKDFAVNFPDVSEGEVFAETTPFIYRVEEEGQGISWRDAKKALRAWFLTQANALRSYNEKQFAAQEYAYLNSIEHVEPVGQVESGAVSSTSA